MRIVRFIVGLGVLYVALALAVDGLIGYYQPQSDNTIVVRTFDADGMAHENVVSLRDDNGQLWVESGHWFRGWYNRLLAKPEIEVMFRDGTTRAYTAVPVNTPEAVALMEKIMGKGDGYRYWVGRTLLLFAPIKPVRLDPRDVSAVDAAPAGDGTTNDFEEAPSDAVLYTVTAEDEERYIASCVERDKSATELANSTMVEMEKEMGESYGRVAFDETASRANCLCQIKALKERLTDKEYTYATTVWTLPTETSSAEQKAARRRIGVSEDEHVDLMTDVMLAEMSVIQSCLDT